MSQPSESQPSDNSQPSDISPPSVILATASYDRTIRFWDVTTGRYYRTIYHPALPVNELQMSHQRNQDRPQNVNKLEISPDKRYLAAACNPYIRIFETDYESLEPVRTFVSHTNNVTAIGFNYDGQLMHSGSEDGTVKIWDMRAPHQHEVYEMRCVKDYANDYAVNTVALHPNQVELIYGDQKGNVRSWDLRVNKCIYELVPEAGVAVRSLTVMLDGTMLVAANDRGICYAWSIMPGDQMTSVYEPLHKLEAHDHFILKCLISPDNRYLATASTDKTVKIWNTNTFQLERVLTASSDETARLWRMHDGTEVQVYRGHHKATVCCALSD
ncbi:unnamed protein product [Microthlaspi erraticum]|uniref:Target of rapamycin complex subunit LST8 n=1 Tax=Microthlaspi erraticum TaxID=1685480 RepID=A0A6D2JX69_9BRAS|nr:unnamed protein product [Microthlaspi erraticum]